MKKIHEGNLLPSQLQLAWCSRTKLLYDAAHEQYSLFPKALADENGIPHKASKSIWTDKLESRYNSSDTPVVMHTMPQGWVPQVAVLDGMFLINTKTLWRTRIVTEYAQYIFDRFALEHFQAGVSEVHLTFDKPGRQPFNPKLFEQTERSEI